MTILYGMVRATALLIIIAFVCSLAHFTEFAVCFSLSLICAFTFFLGDARWKVFTSILLCCTSSKDYTNVSSINDIVKLFPSSYNCYQHQHRGGIWCAGECVWIYMFVACCLDPIYIFFHASFFFSFFLSFFFLVLLFFYNYRRSFFSYQTNVTAKHFLERLWGTLWSQ